MCETALQGSMYNAFLLADATEIATHDNSRSGDAIPNPRETFVSQSAGAIGSTLYDLNREEYRHLNRW
jgi:hypothetical protein